MSIPTGHLPGGNTYTYFLNMDKYERRRLNLIKLRDEQCNGVNAELARRIGREASYVNRMFYPEGKKGKKRIGDDIKELIETEFKLQVGWLDGVQSENLFGLDFSKLTTSDIEYLTEALKVPESERPAAKKIFKAFSEEDGKKEETK